MHCRWLLCLLAAGACSLNPVLPDQAPALADLEEPLELRAEPDDEAERLQLPKGAFSGVEFEDARDTLAAKLDEDGQLRVARVVENSPADLAGLAVGDLLLEVRVGNGSRAVLGAPSQWRQIELLTPPGTAVELLLDRAGRECKATLVLAPRARPAARQPVERLQEDLRVGVVVRSATEVEARAAGLGPGGGAVVVGLSRSSPWRAAGVRYRDLITAVDGEVVAHPQQLLTAIRTATTSSLSLRVQRDGAESVVQAPLSARASETREITIPLLFGYERERGATEWSVLLGMLQYRSTAAAWRFRFLWLFGFGGGDADRLLEVDR